LRKVVAEVELAALAPVQRAQVRQEPAVAKLDREWRSAPAGTR
jgi:hypothetical protein